MNKRLFDKLNEKNIPLIYRICMGVIILVAFILLLALPILSFSYGVSIKVSLFEISDYTNKSFVTGAYSVFLGVIAIVFALSMLSIVPRILVSKEYSRLNWTNKNKKNQELEKMKLRKKSEQSTLLFVLCGIFSALFLVGGAILLGCGFGLLNDALYSSTYTVSIKLSSGTISFLVLTLICLVIDAAINVYIYFTIKDLQPEPDELYDENFDQEQELKQNFENEKQEEKNMKKKSKEKQTEPVLTKPLQTKLSDHMKEFRELKEILDSGIIMQLKDLRDSGIISEEEFETKKKELLKV